MSQRHNDPIIIYSYTRRQAIEDGVLIDVTPTAREAAFRYPVAITRAVWDGFLAPDDESRGLGQSETGRLWDVLTMLRVAIRQSTGPAHTLEFPVVFVHHETTRRTVTLKAVCGPDDDLSPCITIMLPVED